MLAARPSQARELLEHGLLAGRLLVRLLEDRDGGLRVAEARLLDARDRGEDREPGVLVGDERQLLAERGDELWPALLRGAEAFDVGECRGRVWVRLQRGFVEPGGLHRVVQLVLGEVRAHRGPRRAQR